MMHAAPVIPVLVIDDQIDPIALAEALVEGGLPVIEVTLRTPNALSALRAMASVDGAIVGAGTVLSDAMLHIAVDAGARFVVSPGLSDPLARAAIDSGIPFLPGVATAGDIMRGLDHGLKRFKFFPAEAAGGMRVL
ncbi:MAG: 2-dehydro-3-deoxyphosphogluconate aldolase, partial [Pseudomonadota bacterium]|nr:2-dehydro-3-deoxyphosphogluconate aldolase [Pseudomonadota bacterium]